MGISLKMLLREPDAFCRKPITGGCTRGILKAALKSSNTHAGLMGEPLNGMRFVEMSPQPVDQCSESGVLVCLQHGPLNKLRLSTLAMGWHY